MNDSRFFRSNRTVRSGFQNFEIDNFNEKLQVSNPYSMSILPKIHSNHFYFMFEYHLNLNLYLYIFKSWSIGTLQLSYISVHVIIFFFSNFLIIFFLTFTYFLKIFNTLQHFLFPYLFISPLSSTLISPFIFSLIFLYFVSSYSLSLTINLLFPLPFFI